MTFQHHKKFIKTAISPHQGPRGSLLGTNRHCMAFINRSGKVCVCMCVRVCVRGGSLKDETNLFLFYDFKYF